MILKFSKGIPVYPVEIEPIVAFSQLGTPVYDRLIIAGGSYDTYNEKKGEFEQKAYESIKLNDVMLSVTLERNIVQTKIAGRNGTIQEFVSNGNYDISVRGRIVAPYAFQPTAELKKLNAIFRVEKELTIYSRFLNEVFEITQFVIVGRPAITEVEGSRNTLDISFRAVSYDDIKLEVLEDVNT